MRRDPSRANGVGNVNYWEHLYSRGGNSGAGSRGEIRDMKWSFIDEVCPNLEDVIDVGCGDMSFWQGRHCHKYTGIDQSASIIARNRENNPWSDFYACSAGTIIPNLHAQVVFCFDVLFHVLEEAERVRIMRALATYSTDKILVYTWWRNPFADWHLAWHRRGGPIFAERWHSPEYVAGLLSKEYAAVLSECPERI